VMSLLMGPDTIVASRARVRSGLVTPRLLAAPELDNQHYLSPHPDDAAVPVPYLIRLRAQTYDCAFEDRPQSPLTSRSRVGAFNGDFQTISGAQPLACEPVKSVRQQVIDICGQCQPHVPMIVRRHAHEKFPASPLVGQSNRPLSP